MDYDERKYKDAFCGRKKEWFNMRTRPSIAEDRELGGPRIIRGGFVSGNI
jgi:hypothetical protein